MKKINLKNLIMGVVVMTLVVAVSINFLSASRLNKEILTENTLETNRVYAQKLADTTDLYIQETFKTLEFSANDLSDKMDDEKELEVEVDRLRIQNDVFNSVVIVNAESMVIGVSPNSLQLKNEKITTGGIEEANKKRKPMISNPYVGILDNLIIFISHPIFSSSGKYMGLIGGTINIEEDNMFKSVLGKHYYDDGSYVFVVDKNGRIIYHRDQERLNEKVKDSEIVKKVMAGESGSSEVVNSKGIQMLAGYSTVENTGWGVISQRPKTQALSSESELLQRLLIYASPLLIIGLLLVLFISNKIATPLSTMAQITERSFKNKKIINELDDVSGWYYEASILKKALGRTISSLHEQVTFFKTKSGTDGLTNLLNRRTMDEMIERWESEDIPFGILLIDIDHFKSINDTFGHAVGDEVLKYLSLKIKEYGPLNSVCCRYGGEEFVMLFPKSDLATIVMVAEQLRKDLEETVSPCGRPITISGGVALIPHMTKSGRDIVEKADLALYKAKRSGKNKIIVFDESIKTVFNDYNEH